jgi:phosphoribosyl 1,2-cyclic phosphodiesterase
MIAISLQSGSNGNCFYVQSGGTGVLIDAGISGLQAQRRLEQFGIDIRGVSGVFISHDHRDHVRAAGIYHRKFGLPVYMTKATYEAADQYLGLGRMSDIRFFQAGDTVAVGDLRIETVPTPHDGVDGVAFVAVHGRKRLGVLTDLGHVFDGLEAVVRSLDAVFLESNYDPDMLRDGPYPQHLQARISGPGGHISNYESAHLLAQVGAGRLKWACLSHLSEENNEPALALRTHRKIVPPPIALRVASRYEPVGILEV